MIAIDMTELYPETLERLQTEFARFDRDGNGLIDRAEFGSLVESLGAALSVSEADRAFADIDGNGNGRIEFEEFARWWRFRG
jgi:Ca2+-binding EF-hand superfamily protein